MEMNAVQRGLIDWLSRGLPLAERPYQAIADDLGISEQEVICQIDQLKQEGALKRFGIVVRHHELGYRANAMVVWDVPGDAVSAVGKKMGEVDFVTLCYQRPRRLPDWPYNLFCMIHGKDRGVTEARVRELADHLNIANLPRDILFSKRRFKQRGARYGALRVDKEAV